MHHRGGRINIQPIRAMTGYKRELTLEMIRSLQRNSGFRRRV